MNNTIVSNLNLILWVWAFISLGIFLASWTYERRRLLNGILFNLCVLSCLLPIGLFVIRSADTRPRLVAVVVVLFAIVAGIVLLLFLSFVFLLLWNARIVWQREAHTVANSLTLILALGIIALWIMNLVAVNRFLPDWMNQLIAILPLIVFYVLASFYNYLTNLFLYQFNRPRYRQDYVIVLGAGLLNGTEVSPLLAQRIDRGLKFYRKQVQKTGVGPKMVFSGGQGGDEKIAEGAAMAKYAIAQGLAPTDVLAETESKNTLENMQFSKALIQKDAGKPASDCRVIFVSNNYHTFRAGIYARLADLKANGIGSKTSKYFLPNAVIREYIAIFMMKKKQHMIVIGTIVGLDVLSLLFNKIFSV
ncbi:YdcF family protein [Agrilactobacillus yilanensis]|uniref:YdcF family protein n=1 Tax=Agrilactobacillus yilanensis TaxID=2485997 RepID=A0ABW4J728_9LACO|nr:YdcF family protein [Agrilactobacillus yilanensis]